MGFADEKHLNVGLYDRKSQHSGLHKPSGKCEEQSRNNIIALSCICLVLIIGTCKSIMHSLWMIFHSFREIYKEKGENRKAHLMSSQNKKMLPAFPLKCYLEPGRVTGGCRQYLRRLE